MRDTYDALLASHVRAIGDMGPRLLNGALPLGP